METPEIKIKRQTQATEALGRGFLVSHLVREGIGVSLPLWDDGIDLIAHTDDPINQEFKARPLQLKVSTSTYVGLSKKYAKVPQLKMVFVWLNKDVEKSRIFVMSYSALCEMFKRQGHLETDCWTKNGEFSTSRASREKLEAMTLFEFKPKTLRELIFQETDA